MRTALVAMVVLGLLGTCIADAINRQYKTAIIGLLYAVATGIIFWWKE